MVIATLFFYQQQQGPLLCLEGRKLFLRLGNALLKDCSVCESDLRQDRAVTFAVEKAQHTLFDRI